MTAPDQMPRLTLHRRTFALAAIYNIGWASFSALYPNWLFDYASMPRSNHPEIFAAMAMVIGVYGLLYAEVARVPQRGFAIAGVGLLGKLLGPIGWVTLVASGGWPARTVIMCLFNDFLWWPSFALYLWDAWPLYRADLRRSI